MVAHFFAWLFVFTVPWQNVVLIPGLGTISKIVGIGAIAAIGMRVLLRARLRGLSAFHLAVFAYMCWVVLSSFWAASSPESVEKNVKTYLQLFIMVWVIWEAAPTRARLANLLQAYVLGAYVAAGSTIFNYLTGGGSIKNPDRYAASGFDPNDLGMLLGLALPMAWYLASGATTTFQRWVNRAYLVAGVVGILLTGSRGALLVAIVALLVIPWTLTELRRGLRVATVLILIAAGIVAVWFVPATSFRRLSTTTSEISQGNLNRRLKVWKDGLAVVPERPLNGYGPGGWYVATRFTVGGESSHNTYLSILVEEGIIGLLLYLAILVVVLQRLRALPTPFERRVSLTLLAALATALTPLGWDQHKAAWLVLALLVGWSDVLMAGRPAVALPRVVRSPPRPGAIPARGGQAGFRR